MRSRPEPPDSPPAESFISLVEHAARHGMHYQRVYDWVRWGHLAGERYSGGRWVRRDGPQPVLRRGGWGQEERLRVIRAQRSPASWRGTWDRAAAAAKIDPARRREI